MRYCIRFWNMHEMEDNPLSNRKHRQCRRVPPSTQITYRLVGYNEFEALIKGSIERVLQGLCEWEWNIFEWSVRGVSGSAWHPEQ